VPTIKSRNYKAAQSDNLIYVKKKWKRRSTKKKKLKLIKRNKQNKTETSAMAKCDNC
jgi:hypothetical protein